MSGNWYILYTKAGQEKKVSVQLTRKGFDNFCPMNYQAGSSAERRRFSGDVLFPRFVFVFASEEQLLTLRHFPGVVQLVYWLSKPAVVKDEEIRLIRQFTAHHREVTISKSFVDMQEECLVTADPFLSPEKHSISPKKTCVRVLLPSLGFTLSAFIDREELAHLSVGKAGLRMVS